MRVLLAGYNVDSDVVEELKKNSPLREDVSPETLSAAYARISRDPRPVNELRAAARAEVERARRSNQNIIFRMGHHSVAEHAVFNFDIIGISRLAVEEIEKFRLCSFTEKSQRYIALEDDFLIPEEVQNAGKENVFIQMVKAQNRFYKTLFAKLKPYVFEQHRDLAENPKKLSLINGMANEDARYILCLATRGQLGLTINARNLELLIRRFAAKNLAELRELKDKVYALSKRIAPSIILFTEASEFDAETYNEVGEKAFSVLAASLGSQEKGEDVRLVNYTLDADTKLTASLLHSTSFSSYEACLRRARQLQPEEKEGIVKTAFQHMEFYDAPLREFEHVDLTFELVVSAACFAQLKRHRMATLTAQDYDPGLGVTVPPAVEAVSLRVEFIDLVDQANEVYFSLRKAMPYGAEYVLTNAHRRRVLLKINARELYHISRLREDAAAQWDIRFFAARMSQMAKQVMPLTCLLIGGKDTYPEVYKKIFGRPPKFSPPE